MLERTAAVWMRPGLCPPVPTSPHSLSLSICWLVCLSVCLSAPGVSLAVSVSICVTLSVSYLLHSLSFHCSDALCNAAHVLQVIQPSLSQYHLSFFFSFILSLPPLFPLFALSSCPPPPLSAFRSSSAPSQTAVPQLCLVTGKAGLVWERVLCCARHVPIVSSILHVCMRVYVLVLFFGCMFSCLSFVLACAEEAHMQRLSRSDSAVSPAAF